MFSQAAKQLFDKSPPTASAHVTPIASPLSALITITFMTLCTRRSHSAGRAKIAFHFLSAIYLAHLFSTPSPPHTPQLAYLNILLFVLYIISRGIERPLICTRIGSHRGVRTDGGLELYGIVEVLIRGAHLCANAPCYLLYRPMVILFMENQVLWGF